MDSLNKVLKLLESENIFLTGGGGVGKSYLVNEIVKHYKANNKDVIVLGSTGISAVNVGGVTIHSFFAFGISSNFDELKNSDRYQKNRIKEFAKIVKNLDLLIIDEISMVSANLMDMILYRLRTANFRGKIMVVGDFYQLSPVVRNVDNSNIFNEALYAFESSAWEFFDFVNVELTKVKRTDDREFIKYLNMIRVGELDDELINFLESLRQNSIDQKNCTTLFGTNKEAEILNKERLRECSGQEIVKKAIIDIKDPNLNDKALKSWIDKLPTNQELILKEGSLVIFTTNKWGFYHNGERGVVEHIDDDTIVIQKDNRLVKVDRYEYSLSRYITDEDEDIKENTIATFSQFPLRLAYAITIHKSQGMSIENLNCNVDTIFTDSQFYVALSRATDPKKLKLTYNKNYFKEYLKRVIKVDKRVDEFYKNSKNWVLLD